MNGYGKKSALSFAFAFCFVLSACSHAEAEEGSSSSASSFSSDSESLSSSDGSSSSSSEELIYTIDFDLNGGSSSSYKGPRTLKCSPEEREYIGYMLDRLFFFDCVKEGYNFRGWEYEGERVFDGRGNKLKDVDVAEKMTFKALFAQNAALYIAVNMPEAGEVSGAGEYDFNSAVSVSATPNQGYVFVGWYCYGTLLSACRDYSFVLGKDDIALTASFEIGSFSVSVASNNDECGLISLQKYGNKSSGSYGSRSSYAGEYDYKTALTVTAYSKSDVLFLGWYDEGNALVSTNPVYSFAMPSHDYYLEAKWNLFKIEYDLNGGTQNPDNPTSYTLEDGPLTLYAPIKDKDGCTFVGWYNGDKLVSAIEKGTLGNLKLTAKWSGNLNALSVTSEDEGKGTVEIVSGSGYTDETITVKASPIGDCVFNGWYCDSVLVSAKETYSFAMPASDYHLVARFFDKAEQAEAERLGVLPVLDEAKGTITYGLYPQTHVSDAATVAALDSLASADINGWYFYDGQYYAKVTARPCGSPCVFDDGTTIVSGTSYWFRCEPIEWKALSSDDGSYSLVSAALLDAHRYNEYYSGAKDGYYANNYANSDIREWLNGDFLSSAFALGDSHIQTTMVDNSGATTGWSSNQYACENTEDKVYLLSYQDYMNESYFADAAARRCKTTDYARAKVAWYSTDTSYLYNGCYWTRSPDSGSSCYAWSVTYDGNLFSSAVDYAYYAVRPALSINL